MLTPAEFLIATQWAAIGTLALIAIAILSFLLKWGIRFRLVGAAGFAAVLTVGLLGLSFEPFTRTVVPGAAPYATVYDSGSSQVVITVPPTLSPETLEATLRQAASNLFKPYRLGLPGQTATIRARTIVHDPEGVSQLVYLGQIQPAPPNASRDDRYVIQLNPQPLTQLPPSSS
ncbi:MAG: Ycf51 family protein [Nodosilinea sp.]